MPQDGSYGEYERALKVFHNSPQYQSYIAAKTRAQQDLSELNNERPVSSKAAAAAERRIEIQPAEDEEDQDDGFSEKHKAHSRYLRNHRLINEIFSDLMVPDIRSVVTTTRMQVLKRQVQSLTMHQKKLETELQQIEEKFDAKKRKFMESSESFQEELVKHCKRAVDDDTFQKLVEKQYEALKKDFEERVKNSPPAAPYTPPAVVAPKEETTTVQEPSATPLPSSEASTPPAPSADSSAVLIGAPELSTANPTVPVISENEALAQNESMSVSSPAVISELSKEDSNAAGDEGDKPETVATAPPQVVDLHLEPKVAPTSLDRENIIPVTTEQPIIPVSSEDNVESMCSQVGSETQMEVQPSVSESVASEQVPQNSAAVMGSFEVAPAPQLEQFAASDSGVNEVEQPAQESTSEPMITESTHVSPEVSTQDIPVQDVPTQEIRNYDLVETQQPIQEPVQPPVVEPLPMEIDNHPSSEFPPVQVTMTSEAVLIIVEEQQTTEQQQDPPEEVLSEPVEAAAVVQDPVPVSEVLVSGEAESSVVTQAVAEPEYVPEQLASVENPVSDAPNLDTCAKEEQPAPDDEVPHPMEIEETEAPPKLEAEIPLEPDTPTLQEDEIPSLSEAPEIEPTPAPMLDLPEEQTEVVTQEETPAVAESALE
ncbi:unnamed protein product [Allacma fusca]|uniref:Uncharacterized protein n=1 Tax=Allacma fusca TaxID=39272 RepID=A0A8J2KQG3_9HEXA|nr:unnamed protein product [Allacma fusca]